MQEEGEASGKRRGNIVTTTAFQDLAMQSANTLRRAAERSVRGLQTLVGGTAVGDDRREPVREFLADAQADLAGLRGLRQTADELLRDGMEAEAFQLFCEVALAAADMTLQGAMAVEKAEPDLIGADPEQGRLLIAQIKETTTEVRTICSHFRRLAEWLRTPLPSPPETALKKLDALPTVIGPERSDEDSVRCDPAAGF
jgi:hypothetical protein